ncbi:hypothetical protein CIG75_20470 [Tumebacillus algifaecis]|uniref:Uncharacterized protein n=1 Tax=Tumebacillus algifaecis TaxID=1214604 RepID=A0A223D646_9BACL|nr:hypothetical protein [Tumebacillus algifaecis]ASS77041.1 hypothetical protein CIG75_20470 [Tumebacillus algifaecis]
MLGDLFSFLFWCSFALGCLFLILAFRLHHTYYWWAGLCFYTLSFLAAFSFGTATLIITIICWVLAAGYSLRWLRTKRQALACVIVCVLLWLPIVKYVDDYYLFFPFFMFF